MDADVKAAYEAVGAAIETLLALTLDDEDSKEAVLTTWVVATTSARYDDQGQRESHTAYRTNLDSDLATCLGLFDLGANWCRRVANGAAEDDT